jgi:hypothetical protein
MRMLTIACSLAALIGVSRPRRPDPQRRLRRRPEHGRLRQGLSRPDVREEPSRREGRLRRHRSRRCRLAEDLREARRAEGRGDHRFRRGRDPSEGRRNDGEGGPAREIYRQGRHREARLQRDAKNALGSDVSGFVIPMFQSQTALAYNADLLKNPPDNFAELRRGRRRTRSSSATTASRAACPAWLSSPAGSTPSAATPAS